MKKTILPIMLGIFFLLDAKAQWLTSGNNIYNNNTGYVGIGTGSTSTNYRTRLTIRGGDATLVETADYTKMPDGNGADLYLQDKFGGVLDIWQQGNVGAIDTYESSTEIKIGTTSDATKTVNILREGKVLIGAESSTVPLRVSNGYKLFVKDGIQTEKVCFSLSTDAVNWPDYVFDDQYKLRNFLELEKYIDTHKHLPEIAPASEITAYGVDVKEMTIQLLQKVEELTLYTINLNKQNQELEIQLANLKTLLK